MRETSIANAASRPLHTGLRDSSMEVSSVPPTSPWSLPHLETMGMPDTGGSVGSGEDLLDFTQSDMGWDFDFSTMDLEAFLSVYPSNDTVL